MPRTSKSVVKKTTLAKRAKTHRKPLVRGAPVVEQVLRATTEVLAELGYSALTFEEVARRAQVNKTTVYRRWATKAELVRAALRAVRDHRLKLNDNGSLRADLQELVCVTARFMSSEEGRGLLRPLFGGTLDPELIEISQAMSAEQSSMIRSICDRAIARGELMPGVEAQQIGDLLGGAIIVRVFLKMDSVQPAYTEDIIDLLMRGLSPRAATNIAER